MTFLAAGAALVDSEEELLEEELEKLVVELEEAELELSEELEEAAELEDDEAALELSEELEDAGALELAAALEEAAELEEVALEAAVLEDAVFEDEAAGAELEDAVTPPQLLKAKAAATKRIFPKEFLFIDLPRDYFITQALSSLRSFEKYVPRAQESFSQFFAHFRNGILKPREGIFSMKPYQRLLVLLPLPLLLVGCSTTAVKGEDAVLGDLYVSPTGKGTDGAGTKENPFNLAYAITLLHPGHTIYLMEGTYSYSYPIKVDSTSDLYPASSASEMKTLTPEIKTDGTEAKVLFDFSGMPFYSSNRGLTFNTQYWHVKNFEVKGAGDNGVYVGGNHNIIENLNIHDCQDSGLQLGRKSSSDNTLDSWPTDNLIKNCTSHDNHDPTGEDSDGFACKLTTGYGNVFDGCIAYNNVDDGWDLYAKAESGPIGPVTLKNCVSFNNGMTSYGVGTANSDGNGFKLGGEVIPVAHKVYNCVAFNNCAHGFTDNSNPGTISLENCTSYNNAIRDWDCGNINLCRDASTSYNSFKNILSYCDGTRTNPVTLASTLSNSKDEYRGNAQSSVFYYGLAMLKFTDIAECDYSKNALMGTLIQDEITDPFESEISPQPMASSGVSASSHPDIHTLLRNSDGSVNLHGFLKVKSTSPFYTMGSGGTILGAHLNGEDK